jgi:hypothetical protein
MANIQKRAGSEIATDAEVDALLEELTKGNIPGGGGAGLIFALDATHSREGTWDLATSLQAEMFRAAAAISGLQVKLIYYRGQNECKKSRWLDNSQQLTDLMRKIRCDAGRTQIHKILSHSLEEAKTRRVVTVFVGDAMEENLDELVPIAGELGRLGSPVFMFHEEDVHKERVERDFRAIAKASGGPYAKFKAGAADQLRELLKLAAIFASGGIAALESRKSGATAQLLLGQLKK